jgi:hypothetical protein
VLPLLRFPRLVSLSVRTGELWNWTELLVHARVFVMALLEHAHSVEQLELDCFDNGYGFPRPYVWTLGFVRMLANLRCLEISDEFFTYVRKPVQLPCLEYLCLGSRHTGSSYTYLRDIQNTSAPKLTSLTISMSESDGDGFDDLPHNLRWLRLIVWGATYDAFLVSMLTGAPWPFLTTLLLEKAELTMDIATQQVAHEPFAAIIHQAATQCPRLSMLYMSWNFEAHHLMLLAEMACALPLLCILHLEVRTRNSMFEPIAVDVDLIAAINLLRDALPSRVQLTVSHVGRRAVIGQVVEDALRVHHKWVPSPHGWNKFIHNRIELVELETQRLTFLV